MVVTDRLAGARSDLAIKAPCVAATTGNATLSGEQTIDGVSVISSNRVLVKAQTDQTENGIYVASTGTWSRAADFNSSRDVTQGTRVYVHSGSTGSGDYVLTSTGTVAFGTSNITFSSL